MKNNKIFGKQKSRLEQPYYKNIIYNKIIF